MTLERYARYEDIVFERRDHGVPLLTLNRPERYNATDAKLHKALSEVWIDVSNDPETRVAVITGAGTALALLVDLVKP